MVLLPTPAVGVVVGLFPPNPVAAVLGASLGARDGTTVTGAAVGVALVGMDVVGPDVGLALGGFDGDDDDGAAVGLALGGVDGDDDDGAAVGLALGVVGGGGGNEGAAVLGVEDGNVDGEAETQVMAST